MALADPFSGAAWRTDDAAARLSGGGVDIGELRSAAVAIEASLMPVPRGWLGDRLTTLFTMFSVDRVTPSANDVTVWLGETMRLLSDLPHDILAESIDQAVIAAKHNFRPSVGEIRAIADPAMKARCTQLLRLRAVSKFIEESNS